MYSRIFFVISLLFFTTTICLAHDTAERYEYKEPDDTYIILRDAEANASDFEYEYICAYMMYRHAFVSDMPDAQREKLKLRLQHCTEYFDKFVWDQDTHNFTPEKSK